MKTIIQKIWMVIAMLCTSLYASAYDFEVDGFYYNITNQSTNEVSVTYKTTPFNSYSGVINIPSSVSYNGKTYSVTDIGYSTFSSCTELLSVSIPNSVISIGNYAFANCPKLRSVTIGSGVTRIGDRAIGNNDYNIPKVIWLCNTPPSGYKEVRSSMNYVSNSAFSLSNQNIYPFLSSRFEVDGIVYVPVSPSDRTCDVIDCDYNLSNAELKIDSLILNKNVELKVCNVNDYAFYANSKISKLVISNNGYIGNYAFSSCTSLTSVEASNNGYIGDEAFSSCTSLTSVEASNIGYIGDKAFNSCEALTSVSLGNNITSIGSEAFKLNNSLEKVEIPDNITVLGEYIFSECSALKNVSLGSGIIDVPRYAFDGCSSLSSLLIPKTVASIADYAFKGCTVLSDVTFEHMSPTPPQYFPDWNPTNRHFPTTSSSHIYEIDVVSGDVLSFEIWTNCNSDDRLTVFLNGTSIATMSGKNQSKTITKTFNSNESLTLKVEYKLYSLSDNIQDKAGIRNIGINILPFKLGRNGSSALFSDCKLDEVYIGRKISYYTSSTGGYSPFYRNTSLRKVIITDAETQIYRNEFYGCSNLQEFSCGDGVTTIGERAFSGCSSLKSFISGTNVESIGQEAFSDCTALTSFTSNASIPPVCGDQALDDINKWECTLYVPGESIDDYQSASQWKDFFFIEVSGLEGIVIDDRNYDNSPVEIYNFSGMKIGNSTENLSPGIYIKRQWNKSEKIFVE